MLINLIDIHYEDFINYKKPSMFLIFPKCTFKCDEEIGKKLCHNRQLAKEKSHQIKAEQIVDLYIKNPITKAIVCGGLEPFESFDELLYLVDRVRMVTNDDIVIYTGFNEEEIEEQVEKLKKFENIIIKFGRYLPDKLDYYDELLGIKLSSHNQYAKKIS